jgi:predicted nucleotidyltransferase
MPNPNLEQLIAAAALLRPMLGDLMLVGGAVTSLLVTDEGAGLPRATLDVDAIAEISSYAEYTAFGERLRALGFSEDTGEGAPLCRWVHSGTILDVMPLDEKILGFSNRWYRAAMESATTHRLFRDLEIRIVTAPYFLATKLEAFRGRGEATSWRAMISKI